MVLVLEDDELVAGSLARVLDRNGYDVELASAPDDAFSCLRRSQHELVLLDWNLKAQPSGLEFCAAVRSADPEIGIIFTTGRDDPGDIVAALDAGADDYVTKPFDPNELMARMRAVLRRSAACLSEVKPGSKPSLWPNDIVKWGPFFMRAGDRLRVDDVVCRLTRLQERMILRLLQHSGEVVSNDRLWEDFEVSCSPRPENIRMQIHALRRRLGAAGALIETFHGAGYGIGVPSGRGHPRSKRRAAAR